MDLFKQKQREIWPNILILKDYLISVDLKNKTYLLTWYLTGELNRKSLRRKIKKNIEEQLIRKNNKRG